MWLRKGAGTKNATSMHEEMIDATPPQAKQRNEWTKTVALANGVAGVWISKTGIIINTFIDRPVCL